MTVPPSMADVAVTVLTANERNVIRERHHGWERASFALLASIFGVSAREIGRICRTPMEAA